MQVASCSRPKTLFLLATLLSMTSAQIATADDQSKGEAFSSVNRVGCVANLQGHHFNLKELSLPIDE